MGEPHRSGGFTLGRSFRGSRIYSVEERKRVFARRKGRSYPLSKPDEAAWLIYCGAAKPVWREANK